MDDHKPKEIVLQILEYAPLFTGLILLLGCAKLLSYYFIFNLSVFTYVDLGEFILMGIAGLGQLLFYSIFPILIPIKPPKQNQNSANNEGKTMPSNQITYEFALKIIKIERTLWIIFIIIEFISGCAYGIIKHSFNNGNVIFIIYTMGFLFLIHQSSRLSKFYIEQIRYNINKFHFFLINFIPVYLILTVLISFSDAWNVKYENKSLGDTIEIGNKTITSDKTYYYIGETSNYVFFHNDSNLHYSQKIEKPLCNSR